MAAASDRIPGIVRARSDLEAHSVERSGHRFAVVKDPAAHRFYEMRESDWRIARALDPAASATELLATLRGLAPEMSSLPDDNLRDRAVRVSRELRQLGLAETGVGATAPTAPASVRGVLRGISRILFLRIRLVDPTPLLDATAGRAEFLFSRWFAITATLFSLASFAVFLAVGGASSLDPAHVLSLPHLAALLAGIALLKFLHEAGHALAVRHFGGSVHEVGMILVAGLPLFYVEASDSYLFGKRARIAVSAAGIAVEILFAALLIWPWLLAAEGFGKQLLLSLILIASVSTLLFNGNPLMRFDGYFILSDLLDMPSLREKSFAFVGNTATALLAGRPLPSAPRRERAILMAYGLASQVYLLLVVFGIWMFLTRLLEPVGLKWLGDVLIASWVLGSIILPTATFFHRSVDLHCLPRGRILAIGAAALVLLFVPFPRNVERDGALEPPDTAVVRARESGTVRTVLVAEGDQVQAGDPLAMLANPAVTRKLAEAEGARDAAEAGLRAAAASGDAARVGTVRSELLAANAALAGAKEEAGAMVLRAPISGRIATRDLERRAGTLLAPGDLFCLVEPLEAATFRMALSEKEARLVQQGAQATVRLRAHPALRLSARVTGKPLRNPPVPASPPSGSTPLEARPLDTHFVTLTLEIPEDTSLRIGYTGRASVACGSQSLASRTLERFLDFIRLDVRMR